MNGSDRVLVAYGTKHGATAEIAEAIGKALRGAGLAVDVERASGVRSVEPYRAVVLGSAVYAGRWRGDAVRLLRRPELMDRDVWLFSSGPVGEDKGDPAEVERWTKPQQVRDLEAGLGAHEHVVFGGKVDEDAGFIRKKMARNTPPELRDRRDWEQIEAWGRSIAAGLAQRALG
jgi:menaquinone-dependent protoporphyrinogen oxidase